MGCGASVARRPNQTTNGPIRADGARPMETTLQGASLNHHIHGNEETRAIHTIDLVNGKFSENIPDVVEADDSIEFKVNDTTPIDVVQVYEDDKNFYRAHNGFQLRNLTNRTPPEKRRFDLSFALDKSPAELYFCVMPSSENQNLPSNHKYPREKCRPNRLQIIKPEFHVALDDQQQNQKVYLHKGDTLEITWTSSRGSPFRIEERQYCPISGGLYPVPNTEETQGKLSSKGKLSKPFIDYGMSFFVRLNDKNEMYDVTTCLVNENYTVKSIRITDKQIEPNIIWIEQTDFVEFQWNTKRKQTVTQIDPNQVDPKTRKSIELKNPDENFFWPNEPTNRGLMYHQFHRDGVYCFKTNNDQIGTIIVKPRKMIYHVPIFGDQLVHKMSTNDLIQFDWQAGDSQRDTILITVDPKSSVAPAAAQGIKGVFTCPDHKCLKADAPVRHFLHTCENLLLPFPQHGLYNFSYSDDTKIPLHSAIVENGIDEHHMLYTEDGSFENETITIRRRDLVWFDSSSLSTVASIFPTDENGRPLESEGTIFQPQHNSINYFMKQFDQEGVFYFSVDFNPNEPNKKKERPIPLAVIVLPDITFHYRTIEKDQFDSETIISHVNDFVLWHFQETISANLIQLSADKTLADLISCHSQAVLGRNRRCIAVECTVSGVFFFANPEFERVNGSDEHRLISTIVVDPAFGQNCFVVDHQGFTPNELLIAQNETVSWTVPYHVKDPQFFVQSEKNQHSSNSESYIQRNFSELVENVHHLHTFSQPGIYTIQSNCCAIPATVTVMTETAIRSSRQRAQAPQLQENIDMVSQSGTQVLLRYPNQNGMIFYTLDGSLPTRRLDHVYSCQPNQYASLVEPGLTVLRAFAFEDRKAPSPIITSSATYVMEDPEVAAMNENRGLWDTCQVSLSSSLQQPNKLHNTIEVQPTTATALIDHFEFYVNDIAQSMMLSPEDVHFSADGFAGGEQYEVCVVAYPKNNIIDADPIPSNRRAFEVKREVAGGGPLVSLYVSNDQTSIIMIWAHIGDHVSHYISYVDNIETQTILVDNPDAEYGIQLLGVQPKRKYLLHVEAKVKNSDQTRKSNVIALQLPLEKSLKEPVLDRYVPYVTMNKERAPADDQLESIQLNHLPYARPPVTPKLTRIPIADAFRNAVPSISCNRNPNGIMLLWKKTSPAVTEYVENYRVMIDGEQYGQLLLANEEPKFQINLTPGQHECWLEVMPKDKSHEVLQSNHLRIDIPTPATGIRNDQVQQREPPNTPIHRVLEQKDLPIPKLSVQPINSSSIRVLWHPDRAIPAGAFVAIYDVHVRGQDFPEQMSSHQQEQNGGYIEHIWNVDRTPLEITGISERQEYTVFVKAFYNVPGLTDMRCVSTISNEVKTTRVDPLIDLLTRPLLTVSKLGIQTALVAWKLPDSVDQSVVKGYRVVVNSKATEVLSPTQHEYELRSLKPGSTNEIQVSVTSHPDFVEDKVSEPIRIFCPQRPPAPKIEELRAEKPFSISIQWKLNSDEQEEITLFRVFLDGKPHGELETSGRHSFKYELNKLQADREYSIYVKSVIGDKRLDGYTYQCSIESNASNELALKCAAPPRGTTPRVERMSPSGIELVWDAPVEHGQVKITGYQLLKNGRAIGKSLPRDQRRVSINDLHVGNRYSFQVVPITDQPGGIALRAGEEYNSERHGHYLPGPKLEVEFTDLIQLPEQFWIENVTGRSALVCWSPADQSSSNNIQPDSYKLLIWNDKEIKRDSPKTFPIPKDKTSVPLKDLQADTKYEIQLQGLKKRFHSTTNEPYTVSSTSEILSFQTGAPPEAPSNMHLIACTNNAARIGFDPFIEHNVEIITLRVHAKAQSAKPNARDISLELTPDATEFVLPNLQEGTNYKLTIYAITEEYLAENRCRDASQLPKELKESKWLSQYTFDFTTAGCEPPKELIVGKATTEGIELTWTAAKSSGSSEYFGQTLRWKLEQGEEHQMTLDRSATSATISGILPSGLYKITLDSLFSIKINLEETNDETGRREICLSTSKTATVRYSVPNICEQPTLYLTGYTAYSLDLAWTTPHLFGVVDHPEKIGERLKIHRRLLGYRIDIGKDNSRPLSSDQDRCTLTKCQPGQPYVVQLTAQTESFDKEMNATAKKDEKKTTGPDETSSTPIEVRTLKDKDLLSALHAEFVFNVEKKPTENTSNEKPSENTSNQKAETKPFGKIRVEWTVSDSKTISHFILQYRSSKDLRTKTEIVSTEKKSATIDTDDGGHFCTIEFFVVTNDGKRDSFSPLTIPIPGPPDAPELWLAKTSDTSFSVEWSEPKSYGLPIIGYQLFVAGKKSGDMHEIDKRRGEISSRINRVYRVTVCAVTNHPDRPYSAMSKELLVITTPTTDLVPTLSYHDDDGTSLSFDRTIARIIPVQIESINEEKLHVDWTSFLPTAAVRAYYIHYTCLNTGEVQATKVSKRFRQAVLRGLRPGFTYGIMVMAVDKNGGVLYTSEKSTFQMNAPPNAPIVAISERTADHVKIEWRAAASYGEVGVVGYKIFVNKRLAAILSQHQLSYTLTNGVPCDSYEVQVQAITNEKSTVSPLSRSVDFSWPGIKPGAFRRVDNGQTGTILLAWEPPRLEDETEKLIGFKLLSQNMTTQAIRLHGEYDAGTYKAAIYDLNSGKHRLWLEIESENYRVQARPITVSFGRFNVLVNRTASLDTNKFLARKPNRFRSPAPMNGMPLLRQSPYS